MTPSPARPSSGLSLIEVRRLHEQLTITTAECWACDRQRERQAAEMAKLGAENQRLRAILNLARVSA